MPVPLQCETYSMEKGGTEKWKAKKKSMEEWETDMHLKQSLWIQSKKSTPPTAHSVLAIRGSALDRAAPAIFSSAVTQVQRVPWGQLLQGPGDILLPTQE